MIILVFSVHAWRSNAKYSVPQGIALSEDSIAFAGADASGTVPWTSFTHYKETPWSFILWRGSHWVMFPKRAFTSWDDLNRCRDLLHRHLQRSRWFLG
jgi:YcxB-like protein